MRETVQRRIHKELDAKIKNFIARQDRAGLKITYSQATRYLARQI